MRTRLTFGVESVTLPRGETLVGRDDACAIVINDASVSRKHAAFVVDDDAVVLRDLGSRNGTRVNGVRINHSLALVDGDRIRIGPREMLFSLVDDSVSSRRDRHDTGKMWSCAGCGEPMPAEVPACANCGRATTVDGDVFHE